MKKLLAMALLAACLAPAMATAQTEAEMKAWEAYMTPGKEHKMLAEETGSWTAEMTFWHEPGAQPQKATTTADVKMLFDGKYQEGNYKGNVMGLPFEGKSLISFDNAAKEFTSIWIDNMGTGMMVMKAKPGKDAKVLNFTGTMVNPVDGKPTPFREVYTIVDANTRKMEMFDTKNGKEFKSMEIVMKRK
ncbi:hypothetical protein AM493_08295 [Flavobacterium akiainvivens]|uniref:DUF1579 domain-containing protein n=1 Tax=Flavobacterium akiainvivens TaxID=1202724 RepID=A0A0M8MI46_9FLAO|nr:DUF1579 domain-containing protein [Flavobacterium akiainvivens]KOS06038.1 hypothetical protein AM493_08295 [Flavobacterium akiainvivens]